MLFQFGDRVESKAALYYRNTSLRLDPSCWIQHGDHVPAGTHGIVVDVQPDEMLVKFTWDGGSNEAPLWLKRVLWGHLERL